MPLQRLVTGVAIAALLTGTAAAQTPPPPAGATGPQSSAVAGTLNPASESAPRSAPTSAPEFVLADGVLAWVGDQPITGYDLRQRMLLLIAQTQVRPTPETLPALQQQAFGALVDQRLQAKEIATYKDLKVSDQEVDEELALMAQDAGVSPDSYLQLMEQGGISPNFVREQMRTQIG